MTIGFACDYLERRMCELGYGDNYLLKFRHMVLWPKATIHIDADNEYWMFVEGGNVAIKSKFGYYDLGDWALNEQQYEHFGKIEVRNKSGNHNAAKFIQCIPLLCPDNEPEE